MKWVRHLALVLAALALAACGTAPQQAAKTPSAAQAPGPIRSMLWVGNSFFYYNNSMHGHVGQLLSAQSNNGKRNVRQVSATLSGSGLNWHDLASYFKPGGVSSYSFVGDNEVRFNTFDKPFDGVVADGLQPVPDPSDHEIRLHRIRQKAQLDGSQTRLGAGVLHVVGLPGQARDDAGAG